MTQAPHTTHGQSLDPEDWDEFRAVGHRMMDDMVDYLRTVRERPTWQSPSQEAHKSLVSGLPRKGASIADVYADFKRHILPYPTGNVHPRFWGWVMGTGTPVGMLADLLASAMNCHVSGYDQAASLVEHQVIAWLGEMMDFPAAASGLLVSGGAPALRRFALRSSITMAGSASLPDRRIPGILQSAQGQLMRGGAHMR